MKVSIIIPAYNEEEGIGGVLKQIQELDLNEESEIIVVNDGSTDATIEAINEISNEVKIVSHEKNMGYGAALKTGIQHAKNDLIVITDADGTYPNEEIPRLVEEIKEYDMVVGARIAENVNIPIIRRPAKWVLNKLANYLTNSEIPDINSGLRVMRKKILESFFPLLPDGFSFTMTITLTMLTNGAKVKYVPISYHRREGKSKIRPIQDTLNFLQLIIRTVLYFSPLKIFLPISLSFLCASFLLLLYRVFVAQAFGVTATILFVCGVQLLAIGMIADLIDKRLK